MFCDGTQVCRSTCGLTPLLLVHQTVLTLERAGLIKRQPRTARSIELLVDPGHLPELLWANRPNHCAAVLI